MSFKMPRTYVDNDYNRRFDRVDLPVGSAVISKNTVCGMNTKTYVDNDYNTELGRVGMPHGSAVVSKYSEGLTTWEYLNTDRREEDVEHAWRESDIACLYPQDIPRKKANVPNRRERWRSNSSSRESSTDTDKLVRGMTAAETIVEELSETESEIAVTSPFLSNLQWSEGKQSCPFCRTRLRESNLIQDKEFDRIIGRYKQEIKQLKTQIQELKENTKTQEANLQKNEQRYLQLATQLKKKTKQNQKLTDELDKVRKKEIALRKQNDTNVRQCDDHLQELYELKENVLTEKDRMIAQLRNQLNERTRQHDRHTLSEEELAAIQQLQNYYDEKFSRKFVITESMMHALRDKTDTVVDMLSTRKYQKGRLPDFVRNYTSLMKENSSLHQTAIKHEEELYRMKRELRHSKARTHELERKYQLERTLSEE